MTKRLSVALLVLLVLSVMALPASAGSPITEKVTGGAWFVSVNEFNLPSGAVADGHEVHIGFVAMEKDGVVSGQGAVTDKDYRLKAILTITAKYDGVQADPAKWPYDYEGTAELYDNEVYQGTQYFRLNLADGDDDGVVESIGFVLGESPDNLDPNSGGWYFAWLDTWQGTIKVH